MLISGTLAVFFTLLFISLMATADVIDLGDGQFQEIPSFEDSTGEEVEYSGSENNDHHDVTDPEEEQQEDVNNQADDTQDSVESNTSEEVASGDENENVPSEEDNQEDTVQDDYQAEIISLLNNLDQSIKKLMISIWVLFGLMLGTKLIKGLFGYGG